MNSSELNQPARWEFADDEFAIRVDRDDVASLFAARLVVEPGVRALVIEDGQLVGEVAPGAYTLESFGERLRFWRRKQVQAVLTRSEDVVLEFELDDVPTQEHLLAQVGLRLTVRIDDVALFVANLMGTRGHVTLEDLCGWIEPVAQQAAWEATGRMSIEQLTAPEAAANVTAVVEQALSTSLRRYGLRFTTVEAVSVRHAGYAEHRRRLGADWLANRQLEASLPQQEKRQELEAARRLQEIESEERQNDLAVLAEQVGVDRLEGELAVKLRRVGLRRGWREAVLADELDDLESKDKLAQAVHEREKQERIRADEHQQLAEQFDAGAANRRQQRRQQAQQTSLADEYELAEVRAELDHAARIKRLEHEAQLAQATESAENRRWAAALKQEIEESKLRHQQQQEQLVRDRQRAELLRQDEWDALLHEQKIDRVRADVEFARTEQQLRVERLREEFADRQRETELAFQRRKAELEQELQQREDLAQLERLERLNNLHGQQQEHEQATTAKRRQLADDLACLAAAGRQVSLRVENRRPLPAGVATTGCAAGLTDAERAKADAIVAAFAQNAPQGSTLCPACGATQAAAHKFCSQCGGQLPAVV